MGCRKPAALFALAASSIVLVGCTSDDEPARDAQVDSDGRVEQMDGGALDANLLDADAQQGDDAQTQGDAGADASEPFVCNVRLPTSCPEPAPRYPEVAAIIEQRCALCHGADWTGEWPLDTYSHVADWQSEIRDEVVTCAMPPPDARVPITDAERMTILTWIRCGLPR